MSIEAEKYLIQDLQLGKEKAFEKLFSTYYAPLLNYASRILHDTELANDLVQETFCRLYEERKKLNISISLKSYLYKMVYNNCLNTIKHQQIVNRYASQELKQLYIHQITQKPEAELSLHYEDLDKKIQTAIDQLPGKCRKIFILSRIEGLSHKEIAQKLNLSVKTIEAQLQVISYFYMMLLIQHNQNLVFG